jgi:DNA-binding NarL/FixJ family response regulator
MLRLFIADDHALVSETLAQALHQDPDFELLGTATNSDQLRAALRHLRPDLLLLDLYFGEDIRDLSFARDIQKAHPELKIVIFSSETRKADLINQVYQLGLAGYLSKAISLDELKRELKKAGQGDQVFSPDVVQTLFNRHNQTLPKLTAMETRILNGLGRGLKRAAICEELGIRSANTYDTHVQHLKEKFEVGSTSKLLRRASELDYL